MRLAQYPLFTSKETPADAEIASHQLMLRAGMIRRLASGLYTWMPLGLRVLARVEAIVREEMDRAGCFELLMPAIQPAELWQATGRWEAMGGEMLKIKDRHERDFCFGPTHEEVITTLFKGEYRSYKQLPVTLYQIQTKFRDEIRPRFGVMRAREFLMKDAYSFHMDQASLDETYQRMRAAYIRVFERLGVEFRIVEADSGNIGGNRSEEFHVLAETGEDELMVADGGSYAANVEVAGDLKEGDPSPDGKGTIRKIRGIEVGHIFQLGDKYSQSLEVSVLDTDGKLVVPQMGCYGIGISRIVGAVIEQTHDDAGMHWPDAIAPFRLILAPINYDRSERVRETCSRLYEELTTAGIDVALDDRGLRPGAMFADADLVGIPHRVVIGERGLDAGKLEYKRRSADEASEVEPSAAAILAAMDHA